MSKRWQALRQLWLREPWHWIFLAFFQPRRFAREFEMQYPRRRQRALPLLRLLGSMILLDYPLVLLCQFLLLLFSAVSPFWLSFLGTSLIGVVIGVTPGVVLGIVGGIAEVTSGVLLGIALGIVGGVALLIVGGIGSGEIALGIGLGGIILGIGLGGIILETAVGIVARIAGGIALGIALGIGLGITAGITGIVTGIVTGATGSIAVMIGLFRLIFYPFDVLSLWRQQKIAMREPAQVFEALHQSALYWDELVYLPLPFLKQMLLLAWNESHERFLEEIAFISAERPLQIRVARTAALEIVLRDLESRQSLARIAEAETRLRELLPPGSKLIEVRWAGAIIRLSEASRDAARAIAPIGLQGRRRALSDLLSNLEKIHPNVLFRDQQPGLRLRKVIETWCRLTRQEEERLSQAGQDIGTLDNPYKPGQVLALEDSLFVGRRLLARELEGALSLGSRRPTFLLNGERRMGKTSVLQQLPYLLGSSYVSVFYSLQQPGIYADTASFLNFLADGIYRAMKVRAMPVERLAIISYGERLSSNDARIYRSFERWMSHVEQELEREERTLLLALDEFEKLEEAEEQRYMQVRPLLDWMRSIIQFHPRVALLLSGVKTFDEMGERGEIDWNGYFINVQVLRVSFLTVDEARMLILHPTPQYPGSAIFSPEVVEQIIQETGCHPFLIQAMCSALITLLNVDVREQTVVEDVTRAGKKVLSDWSGHFTHLWKHSDAAQKACLEALLREPQLDVSSLVERTGLDRKTVRRTFQLLLQRDLIVSSSDETCALAVPLFRRWLEQNV